MKEKLSTKLSDVIDKSGCSKNGLLGVWRFDLSVLRFTAPTNCWEKELLPTYKEIILQVKQIESIRKWASVHIETAVSRGPDGKLMLEHELRANFNFSMDSDGKIHSKRKRGL